MPRSKLSAYDLAKMAPQEIGEKVEFCLIPCCSIDRSKAIPCLQKTEFIITLFQGFGNIICMFTLVKKKFNNHELILILQIMYGCIALSMMQLLLYQILAHKTLIENKRRTCLKFLYTVRTIMFVLMLGLSVVLISTTIEGFNVQYKNHQKTIWGKKEGIQMIVNQIICVIMIFVFLMEIFYWTYYMVTISNEEIDDIEEGKVDFLI